MLSLFEIGRLLYCFCIPSVDVCRQWTCFRIGIVSCSWSYLQIANSFIAHSFYFKSNDIGILGDNKEMLVFVEEWWFSPFFVYCFILSSGHGPLLDLYGSAVQETVYVQSFIFFNYYFKWKAFMKRYCANHHYSCLKKVRNGVSLYGCFSATVDSSALLEYLWKQYDS